MPDSAYGFIILAAGKSSRMGKPKALLPYRDARLIDHVITEMKKMTMLPVIVVTGAYEEEMRTYLWQKHLHIAHNSLWQEGVASSIRTGLANLFALRPNAHGALFAVCDQPAVSAELFQAMLVCRKQTQKTLVACAYEGTVGTPALFAGAWFPYLSKLRGNEGAKKILEAHPDDLATVPFAAGALDIDTPEDYARLINKG